MAPTADPNYTLHHIGETAVPVCSLAQVLRRFLILQDARQEGGARADCAIARWLLINHHDLHSASEAHVVMLLIAHH